MWLFLALLTAFFVSLRDIIARKIVHSVDVHIVAWAWPLFSLPFLLGILVQGGMPSIGPLFWPAAVASIGLLTAAILFYYKGIQASELSLSMPMLTFTPLFLLITSPIMIREFPSGYGLLGIILIVTGSYVLNIKEIRRGFFGPFKALIPERGPRYMLIVAFLYSIGANLDKIGVRNSSPGMWAFVVHAGLTVTVGIVAARNTKDIKRQIKGVWVYLLAMGACCGIAVFCQFTAIQLTLVPYVIAIKRTSALITSVLAFIIFKEKGFLQRLTGAILMVLGVFIISFFNG